MMIEHCSKPQMCAALLGMHGRALRLALCLLCSQNVSAVPSVPLVMALPPGVGAVDFYIDLAIDCVETVNVTKPCQVNSAVPCQSCTPPTRRPLPVQPASTFRELKAFVVPQRVGSQTCMVFQS